MTKRNWGHKGLSTESTADALGVILPGIPALLPGAAEFIRRLLREVCLEESYTTVNA